MEQAHFWLLREQREATTQLRTQRRSQAAPGRPEAAGVAPQARLPLPAPPPASAPAPSSGSGNHRQSSALCSAVLAGSTEAVEDLVAAGACAGRSGGAMGRGHPALHAVVLAAQRGEAGMLEAMYPSLEQELKGKMLSGRRIGTGAVCCLATACVLPPVWLPPCRWLGGHGGRAVPAHGAAPPGRGGGARPAGGCGGPAAAGRPSQPRCQHVCWGAGMHAAHAGSRWAADGSQVC